MTAGQIAFRIGRITYNKEAYYGTEQMILRLFDDDAKTS
jgi:hypothetical protein